MNTHSRAHLLFSPQSVGAIIQVRDLIQSLETEGAGQEVLGGKPRLVTPLPLCILLVNKKHMTKMWGYLRNVVSWCLGVQEEC